MNEHAFINEMPEDRGPGLNKPDEICAANASSRFVEAFFSEPLTTYSLGWTDQENLKALLEFLAPEVPTSRRFEYGTFPNAEAFLSETDDIRAIGADFKRVEYTQTKANGKTLNKGLTVRVDLDNVDQNTNWRELTVSRLMERLLRNEIRRAITLLSAASTNSAKTWDTTAGKDPDQDVLNEAITYNSLVGIPPTNVLYDLVAWGKRILAHRAQNTAGGFASAGQTVDQAAQFAGLQRGYISRSYYQTGPASKSAILGGNRVLIFNTKPNATPFDPSNIKRFTTATVGGTMTRVYEFQQSMKNVDITVEMYSDIVISSTLGLRQLTIT